MIEGTQLVGYFRTKHDVIHLFFNWNNQYFSWASCEPYHGLYDIRSAPGVKIFEQEPHLELYAAKTWEEAKKWFE